MPVECRGCNAARLEKLEEVAKVDTGGDLVCALSHSATKGFQEQGLCQQLGLRLAAMCPGDSTYGLYHPKYRAHGITCRSAYSKSSQEFSCYFFSFSFEFL